MTGKHDRRTLDIYVRVLGAYFNADVRIKKRKCAAALTTLSCDYYYQLIAGIDLVPYQYLPPKLLLLYSRIHTSLREHVLSLLDRDVQ
jgi:hypothetical protein